MPLRIVRDDITHLKVDAIVNAANEHLRRGGGVCGAIFAAAGPDRLQAACDKIGHCDTGTSVVTPGFGLSARHIIHTVGPIWQGGSCGEEELLRGCYRTALALADELGDKSIAFPLISSGIYGYPKDQAIDVALSEIRTFLDSHEMEVFLTIFDSASLRAGAGRFANVAEYIDDLYVRRSPYLRRNRWERPVAEPYSLTSAVSEVLPEASGDTAEALEVTREASGETPEVWEEAPEVSEDADASMPDSDAFAFEDRAAPAGVDSVVGQPSPARTMPYGGKGVQVVPPMPAMAAAPGPASAPHRSKVGESARNALGRLLHNLDASFSTTLMSMIDERGMKDSEVYKRANMSRQHFSKIRSKRSYHPTKQTVLALAVALELSMDETRLLLERAGYALTHADERDVIVEYFIDRGMYDIYEINLALYAFDQPLLG